jgi:hypothetical protein
MPILTRKFKIWQIMLATAMFACLFAAGRFSYAPEICAAFLVTGIPIAMAGRGRRLRAASWICSLYPLLVLGSFYAVWLTAWCMLGHRPRISVDDPKGLGPTVIAPIKLCGGLILGLPIAFVLLGPLVLAHDVQSFRADGLHENRTVTRLLIPLIVWLGVCGIVWLRLFGLTEIFEWYGD